MWIVLLRTHTSVACFTITFQKINWCIKMSTVIVTSLHFIQLKKLRIKIKLGWLAEESCDSFLVSKLISYLGNDQEKRPHVVSISTPKIATELNEWMNILIDRQYKLLKLVSFFRRSSRVSFRVSLIQSKQVSGEGRVL